VLLLTACGAAQTVTIVIKTPHTPGALADTWFGKGSDWKAAPGPHPPARYAAALAYDAARKDFVMFGGQFQSTSFDETWTFDGKSWKQQDPAHKPSARRNAAMAYDPALRVVVLYGGLVAGSGEGSEAADTWTWDGTDWVQVSLSNDGP